MVYTGGHDGTIIVWNFDTGYAKYKLHDHDKTCLSKEYIKDGKSVDQLLIMEGVDKNDGKLVSMSADQYLRFWNLNELSGGKQPSFKYYCKHNPYGDNDLDGLSAIQLTQDNTVLLTGDTSG